MKKTYGILRRKKVCWNFLSIAVRILVTRYKKKKIATNH